MVHTRQTMLTCDESEKAAVQDKEVLSQHLRILRRKWKDDAMYNSEV